MRVLTFIFVFVLVAVPVFAQKPKPKPTPVKPVTAQAKKPDEKGEWDKATALEDVAARVSALQRFNETFPNSSHRGEALLSIATGHAQMGNDKMAADDLDAASTLFKSAAAETPKPISDQQFTDTYSKLPTLLYFKGARAAAFEIAKSLEEKAEASAPQLLGIAAFYLSVENGTEAQRVAEKAVALEPTSLAGYQTLALAHRMDFELDEAAAAYTRAVELAPESLAARGGLAEMKRSLGKADEAVALYREILAKEEANLPARTGLILSLFDAGKRSDAESEMTRSLEANPANLILLGGAAYWYAAHDEGQKAVDLAQKAIDVEPRFIWSHIALARGLMSQKKPLDAERVLLAARRYGNFPTLHYELASARAMAGFYRDAMEELAKSFAVKEGLVSTRLGGRVAKGSATFTELIGFERRASIFEPSAADSPEMAAQLRSLLEFKQALDAAEPNGEAIGAAADVFARGQDPMRVHRQVFAAAVLVERKLALPKALELLKAAAASSDAALDAPSPVSAIMASELYEPRTIAAARGEYLTEPSVPRATLSSVFRGRIEELNGTALLEMDNPTEAIVHFRRAIAVLPLDSAWWRSTEWQLGSALARSGKDADALDAYIKSYRSGPPEPVRYSVIESLYKRVNSNTDGLEAKIGPNPAPPDTARQTEPTATPAPGADAAADTKPATDPAKPDAAETKPSPTPEATPKPSPDATPESQKPVDEKAKIETPETTPAAVPAATPKPSTEATPGPAPKPTPETTPETVRAADDKPKDTETAPKVTPTAKDLFPPVVITIPPPDASKKTTADPVPSPTPAGTNVAEDAKAVSAAETTAEIKPCKVTSSEESLTLQNGGGQLAVIIGTESDIDLTDIVPVASSPMDISVTRAPIFDIKTRALFVVKSASDKPGVYQVVFMLPCGKKELLVRVR